MPTDLRLIGSGSSPYTRKLRAALRYRRIPYRFVVAGSEEQKALPERPLPLMPCLGFPDPDGEPTDPMSDTTPILNRLEDDFPERSVRPADPALRFIDALIEEEGDEASRAHARNRLGTLRSWQQRTRKLMPIVMAVLGGAKFFDKEPTDEETII